MQKPRSGQPGNEQKAPNSHLAHVPTEQTIKDGGGTLIYLPIANSASLNFGSIFTLSLYVRLPRNKTSNISPTNMMPKCIQNGT